MNTESDISRDDAPRHIAEKLEDFREAQWQARKACREGAEAAKVHTHVNMFTGGLELKWTR